MKFSAFLISVLFSTSFSMAQTSFSFTKKDWRKSVNTPRNSFSLSRTADVNGQHCLVDSTYTKAYSNTLGFYNQGKVYYSYDANENCISNYFFNYDTLSNQWSKYYKVDATFNAQNVQQDLVMSLWNTSTNTYDANLKLIFHLNAANTMTLFVEQSWTGTQWQDTYRQTFTVSSTGKNLHEVSEEWNFNTSVWENQRATTNSYNTADDNTDQLFMLWNNGSWINSAKTANTYDNNHNIVASVGFSWDTSINNWINSYKTNSSFNANNDLLSATDQYWDTISSSYINSSLQTCSYNSSNKLLNKTFQFWNESGNNWINSTTFTFNYNSNGTQSSQLGQLWDTSTETWMNYENYLMYYTCKEVATVGLKKENALKNSFKLYPNPAHDLLNIETEQEYESLQILSCYGKIIKDQEKSKTISIEGLSAGLYFVCIKDKNKNTLVTQKITIY